MANRDNEHLEAEFAIFPNPAKENFTISSSIAFSPKCNLIVYDISGRVALNVKLPEREMTTSVDARSLQTGLYIVKVQSQSEVVFKTKLNVIK